MVFALLKNALFPPSSPYNRASSRRALDYGTLKELLTDTMEAVEATRPGSPRALSEASTDVPTDVEAQLLHERGNSGEGEREGEEELEKTGWRLSPRLISDALIGLSDGLTVPFALTAGLSGLGDTRVVVLGGLAELIAGAISMGLGGFIGAKSEAESYNATLDSTRAIIQTSQPQTEAMVRKAFKPYGLTAANICSISKNLHDSPEELLDFLMKFHHQEPAPETSRPFVCAATIALGYFLGGFLPLLPYFFVSRKDVLQALWWSVGLMIVALFVFGWVKTGIVRGWAGSNNIQAAFRGGLQMVLVGGLAAGAAVGLVRAVNES